MIRKQRQSSKEGVISVLKYSRGRTLRQKGGFLFFVVVFFFLIYFLSLYLFIEMQREREAETQAEGEACSMQRA